MRKRMVAGNWKMNKNLQEGVALATELKEQVKNPKCEVVIGTPFIHLATVCELLKGSAVKVAAENCADKEKGAYTGEVSAEMVASTGAEYCILGHSERRAYYHETPEILKVQIVYKQKYVAFKYKTNFVDVIFQKQGLRLTINLKYSEINDPKHLTEDVSHKGRWGNGEVSMHVINEDNIADVIAFAQQAISKQR